MQFDKIQYKTLPKDTQPGDVFYYQVIGHKELYHSFIVMKINDLSKNDVEICHFDSTSSDKLNSYVHTSNLKDVLMERRMGKVILTGEKPLPRNKRIMIA